MSIYTDSKLFVGVWFEDLGINEEELDELLNGEIESFSPFYDSATKYRAFGVEVDVNSVMTDKGRERINQLIAEMNTLLKTNKCKLDHTPDVH
jgi:hypothetical protein